MSGGRTSLDDDDDVAKLMPITAKLIHSGESNSLESNGSTSLNFSPDNLKENIQNPISSRKRRRESIFREVANRFLQRGAAGKRMPHSSALATLSSNRRNASAFDKENVKPTAPAQGARATLQQKLALRNESQKFAGKVRKQPLNADGSSYFSVNSKIQKEDKSNAITLSEDLAEPAAATKASAASRNDQGSKHFGKLAGKSARSKLKIYKTTVPLDLSELKNEFAQLDEEALEEEEIPIARVRRTSLVAASKTLYLAKNIQQNSVDNRKKMSKSEGEKVVSNTVNEKIEEAALPICSHGHEQEGAGICIISSGAPAQDQNVQVSQQTGEEKNAGLSSGHDRNTNSRSVRKISPPDNPRGSPARDLDDAAVNQADNVEFRNVEASPHIEQHAPSLPSKVLDNQASGAVNARTADTTASPCQLEACVLEMSGKGTNVSAQIELANAEGSCNTKRGCTPTNPNVDNLKETAPDGPNENAGLPENSVPRHSPAFRVVRRSASKAKHSLKQEDVHANPRRGTLSPEKSATRCLHRSRRGRIIGINQRRLTFDSCSDSKQKATARDVGSDSTDASVEVQGRTNSSADIINHDGLELPELPANMTSAPNQEANPVMADDQSVAMADDQGVAMADDQGVAMADDQGVAMADDQGVAMADDQGVAMADDQLVDRDCTSVDCLNLQAATHRQGVVSKEKALTESLAQGGNLTACEASRGMSYCFNSPSPHAGRTTKCLKIRGSGKRTWANLGAPIERCSDGGSEWKEGRRVSTRIKSRPLDWWRGERMLYGRVHSTLCTLIGIKTTTPDPVWPGPKPQRGDYTTRKFHIDSFVDESHVELLRLAAQ